MGLYFIKGIVDMLKTLCRSSILGLTALYAADPFHNIDLRPIRFICAILILFCSVPTMNPSFRRSSLFFFLAGAALLVMFHQAYGEWVAGMVSMLNIIAILAVMQLFSIPIQLGKYNAALETLYYKKFDNEFSLFFLVSFITHFFASFLLFGTIPVMISLFDNLLKRYATDYKRFAATAISRGYSLVILWAPGGVNILLILQTTEVSWVDIFFPGFILSMMGIGLSLLMERSRLSTHKLESGKILHQPENEMTISDALKKMFEVFAVIVGLIVLMVVFDWTGFATSTTRILFSGLIVVGLWLWHLRNQPGLRQELEDYWNVGLLKTMDLSALFICLGLFSNSVLRSNLLAYAQPVFAEMTAFWGPSILLLGTPPIIVLCAVMGLHPFVSLVILGQMIVGMDLGAPRLPLALALSLGGALSYIVSPFAGIVLTLSRFLDSRPTDIAWRWNWQYCIIYLVLGIFFIVMTQ